jgi:hypothetical protein
MNRKGNENELLINFAGEEMFYPDRIVIALRSNSFTYGPWKPTNIIESGPPGQIKFELQEDLVPWKYGSMYNLGIVGQARANAAVSVMTQGEMGNVTIVGWPTIPIGSELCSLQGLNSQFFNNNQHLIENRVSVYSNVNLQDSNNNSQIFTIPSFPFGNWNGSFGPTITNINVEGSTAGTLSTTYTFRTYTPKFGSLSKLNAERLEKRFTQENKGFVRNRLIQELKQLQRKFGNALRKLSYVGDSRGTKATPHSVLVAQNVPWDSGVTVGIDATGDGEFRRSIVSSKSLLDIQNQLFSSTGYDNHAIMSLDGLFRPISMSGDGGLPRYVANAVSGNRGVTQYAIPPFGTGHGDVSSLYNNDISLRYLNPLSNPSGFAFSELQTKHSGFAGHDFDILARGALSGISGDSHSLILPVDSGGYYNTGTRADYRNDYRYIAWRGPLVMQGWGYDTEGKPIPNAADSEVAIVNSGTYTTNNLQNKFLPNFLRKSHTWPVAPVDLRFDRQRNVWTSVPPYQLVVATIIQDITGNASGLANFAVTGYDNFGNPVNNGTIVVHEKLGAGYTSGSKVFSYYDTRLNEYSILGGGGGGGSTDIKYVFIDYDLTGVKECPAGISGTLPTYTYQRQKYDLKYYTALSNTGDSCYNTGANPILTLATGMVPSGTGTGLGPGYFTVPIFYDDGKTFEVGKYTRQDYPSYNENLTFPPTGLTANFLHKKWRGIAINSVLVTTMCKVLPAPALPTG